MKLWDKIRCSLLNDHDDVIMNIHHHTFMRNAIFVVKCTKCSREAYISNLIANQWYTKYAKPRKEEEIPTPYEKSNVIRLSEYRQRKLGD